MQCALYDAERYRSRQWITQPVVGQPFEKTADLQNLLAEYPVGEWYTSVSGPESASRNKAKMVVGGSVKRPLLGMLHRDGMPEGLCSRPLYPESFAPVFPAPKPFIARAGLMPYNVTHKRRELKYLLLTESRYDGGAMLRFVLRSDAETVQLRAALPWLQARFPQLKVITANIQPMRMATMGGETKIFLTGQQALVKRSNDVLLWIRPQNFFQINSVVAGQLYATTRDWMR